MKRVSLSIAGVLALTSLGVFTPLGDAQTPYQRTQPYYQQPYDAYWYPSYQTPYSPYPYRNGAVCYDRGDYRLLPQAYTNAYQNQGSYYPSQYPYGYPYQGSYYPPQYPYGYQNQGSYYPPTVIIRR